MNSSSRNLKEPVMLGPIKAVVSDVREALMPRANPAACHLATQNFMPISRENRSPRILRLVASGSSAAVTGVTDIVAITVMTNTIANSVFLTGAMRILLQKLCPSTR